MQIWCTHLCHIIHWIHFFLRFWWYKEFIIKYTSPGEEFCNFHFSTATFSLSLLSALLVLKDFFRSVFFPAWIISCSSFFLHCSEMIVTVFPLFFAFLFTLSFAWQIDLIILGENINAEGFASLDVTDSVPTSSDVDTSVSTSFDNRTCCTMLIACWSVGSSCIWLLIFGGLYL